MTSRIWCLLLKIKPRLPAGVPALAISGDLAEGEVGIPYSSGFVLAGGVAPYTSVASGLPSWASINSTTGAITGNPDAAASTSVTVTATDAGGSPPAARTDSIVIYDELTLSGSLTSPINLGDSYSDGLTASGGKTPYFFEIISGSLPDGLTINSGTGLITGTATTAATFNFTYSVTDALGGNAISLDTIVVNGPAGFGFNPADKGTHIVLSNGNFSCATSGAGGWESVRSVTSHSSGKYLLGAEFQYTTGGAGVRMIGLADSSASLASYLGGGGGKALAWQFGTTHQETGGPTFHGSFDSTLPTPSDAPANTKYQGLMAIDFAIGVWLSDHTQSAWMGGGDPVAGTNPTFTFDSAAGSTFFAAMSVYLTEPSAQTIFTSGPWPSTVAALAATCTGFSDWG